MECQYCGQKIRQQGNLWLDDSKIFPQYCTADFGGQLHEPEDADKED